MRVMTTTRGGIWSVRRLWRSHGSLIFAGRMASSWWRPIHWGQPIEFLDRRDPVPGYDLHLTLDMGLQQAAMDALEKRIGILRQKGE